MDSPATVAAPRRRVLTYDALRTLAIGSVVAIHSLMPARALLPPSAPMRLTDDVLHYAVPLFVFISGALVWGRRHEGGPASFRRFARGRLRSVAAPYAAWALVYLGVALARSADPTSLLRQAVWQLLNGHVWYHLYFVPMLLTFYLLTPVAWRLVRRWPELCVIAVYAARVLLWPDAARALEAAAPDALRSWVTHLATHLPHMVLGAAFAVRMPSPPKAVRRIWPVLLGAGTAVLLADSLGRLDGLPKTPAAMVYPLGMAATVLGLALGAFWLEPHYDRFARVLVRGATLSFGVYFVHPLLLLGLWEAVDAAGATEAWASWWAVSLAWAAVTAASFAVSRALARSHATAWLVGTKAGAGG